LLCAPTGGILFDPLRAHKKSSVLEGFFVVRPRRGDFIRPPPSSQRVLRFGGLFCCAPPQGGFYSTPSELTKSPPFWRAFLLPQRLIIHKQESYRDLNWHSTASQNKAWGRRYF